MRAKTELEKLLLDALIDMVAQNCALPIDRKDWAKGTYLDSGFVSAHAYAMDVLEQCGVIYYKEKGYGRGRLGYWVTEEEK